MVRTRFLRLLKYLKLLRDSRAERKVVGERLHCSEAPSVNSSGAMRSENAGMSSESPMRIRTAECPRFPTQRSST